MQYKMTIYSGTRARPTEFDYRERSYTKLITLPDIIKCTHPCSDFVVDRFVRRRLCYLQFTRTVTGLVTAYFRPTMFRRREGRKILLRRYKNGNIYMILYHRTCNV